MDNKILDDDDLGNITVDIGTIMHLKCLLARKRDQFIGHSGNRQFMVPMTQCFEFPILLLDEIIEKHGG